MSNNQSITLRKKSIARVLCMYLLRIGMCFKSDLALIGKQYGEEKNAYKTIAKLINNGYINETIIKGKVSRTTTALSLSKTGRTALLNKLYDEGDIYWNKGDNSIIAYNKFKTSDEKKLIRYLTSSTVQTMLFISDIAVFRNNKPKLYILYQALLNDNVIESNNDEYLQIESKEQAFEYLNKGIYYSIDEIREFVSNISHETDISDTSYACKAKGIVLTNETCFIIYAQKYQSTKMVPLNMNEESYFLSCLKPILKLTNVNRTLKGFIKHDANGITSKYIGEPYALVLCNGEALVYTMATGSPQGHIKKVSSAKVQLDKRKYFESIAQTSYRVFLDGVCPLYKRIFAIPKGKSGLHKLNILLHTSAEQWLADSRKQLKLIEGVKEDNFDSLYPYLDEGQRTIFMPVYEIKEFYNISERNYPVSIMTDESMIETIAHSIRVPAKYYSEQTGELIQTTVGNYDKNGYYKGQQIIKSMLESQLIFTNNKFWNDLPRKFDMTPAEFYNAVCEDKIDLDKVASISLDYIIDRNNSKHRSKKLSISVTESLANDIKKAAKYKNISKSSYVKYLIVKQVREDAKAYDELLKENRNMWK